MKDEAATFGYESSLRPGELHEDGTVTSDGADVKISLWGRENEHTLFCAGRQDGWSHFLLVSTAPDDFIKTREWRKKGSYREFLAFRSEVHRQVAAIVGEHTTADSVSKILAAIEKVAAAVS